LYGEHKSALDAIVRAGQVPSGGAEELAARRRKALAEWPGIRHTLESAIEAVKGKRGRATDYRR
jgi:hypothetical protein